MGLGATHVVHLRLFGKHVVVLRAKSMKIGVLEGVDQFRPNIGVEGDVPNNHFCTDIDTPMNALQLCH